MNLAGEGCPNGAQSGDCLCSATARRTEWEKQARDRKRRVRKFWAATLPLTGVIVAAGLLLIGVDYLLLRPRPLTLTPFYWIGMAIVCEIAVVLSILHTEPLADESQQLRELRCAVRLLLREREERAAQAEEYTSSK